MVQIFRSVVRHVRQIPAKSFLDLASRGPNETLQAVMKGRRLRCRYVGAYLFENIDHTITGQTAFPGRQVVIHECSPFIPVGGAYLAGKDSGQVTLQLLVVKTLVAEQMREAMIVVIIFFIDRCPVGDRGNIQ